LKAESGLVAFRKRPLPEEGVEFDAPATVHFTRTAAEGAAARVAAIFPSLGGGQKVESARCGMLPWFWRSGMPRGGGR
jgi:hypothetical protein